jgi:uncharacterized protein with HEPN domain
VNDRDRLYLQHVLDAIEDAQAFTVDGRESFMSDRKTQHAVIRQLEIFGEAVKQPSSDLTSSHPQVPWRQVAGTRDRLIKGTPALFSVPSKRSCATSRRKPSSSFGVHLFFPGATAGAALAKAGL